MLYSLTFDGTTLHLDPGLLLDFEPFALGRAFVVTANIDPAISIYPMVEWEIIVSEIDRLPNTNANIRRLQRTLYAHAETLTLTPEKTLVIPQSLKSYAGIRKRAVALPFANKIEIWNPETLKSFIRSICGRDRDEILEILRESCPSVLDGMHPLRRLKINAKTNDSE